MTSMASCGAFDLDGGVSDVPVTAIACPGRRGDVYCATGNTVHHSRSPHAPSTCIAAAPPATTISVIAVSCGAASPSSRPLVLMGAADHLLAKCAGEGSCAFLCCVVLRADEGRVLSIAVDEERDVVVVLTASNDVFCARLRRVVEVVVAHSRAPAATSATPGSSPPPPLQLDLSRRCTFTRVCGPRLGVVLAADCLVRRASPSVAAESVDDASLVHWEPYRLFAATYAGAVVEWEVVRHRRDTCSASGASDPSLDPEKAPSLGTRVVSHVQPHAAGCAIFATRAAEALPPHQHAQSNDSVVTAVEVHTHLVTCSDDRSVALYAQRRLHSGDPNAGASTDDASSETPWVLLWRGGGVGDGSGASGFARSRVFDVALHVRWTSTADGVWRCAASVGVAGEDGAVQAIEVVRAGDGEGAAAHATPRLICPRQHRGHGAYRVAFAESSTGSLTLVSGGFDGVLLAHSLPPAELLLHPRSGGTDAHAPLSLQTDVLLARPSCGAALTSDPTPSPPSGQQVRTVHVDAHGRVLACTSTALCVQCDGGDPDSWWIPLPRTATSAIPGRDQGRGSDWGMPATLDSLVADCAMSTSGGRQVAPVGCALVGTTAGALCLVPYASCEAGSAVRSRGSRPVQVAGTAGGRTALLATLTLEGLGKATHITVLRIDADTLVSATPSAESEFLVASSHVRNAVVLSRLVLTLAEASSVTGETACCDDALCVDASATWQIITVYTDSPGALTTTLTLLPTAAGRGPRRSGDHAVRDSDAAPLPVWLLVGDRNGCLMGARATTRESISSTSGGATSQTTGSPSGSGHVPTVSLPACAELHRFIFAAHLRLAIVAVCGEKAECGLLDVQGQPAPPSPAVLLTVAGTGGVVAFVYLPDTASSTSTTATGPLPATAPEPLRLPFEVASVLAITPQVVVAQSGTCVAFLHRVPGQSSWVPVGGCAGVRAPRLLTARVTHLPAVTPQATDVEPRGALVFFAHCSDGRTVERAAVCSAGATGSVDAVESSTTPRLLRLLRGAGFPGKDYNCVAYAPAPLRCLLMGNEDSSLALHPVRRGTLTHAAQCAPMCDGLETPLNVCGAHHSNILAITVLPTQSASGVRFVTVGGGAMVNLWAADVSACPLQLLDWWCGGTVSTGDDGRCDDKGAEDGRRPSAAHLQKRRERPAMTSAAAAKTLTDRIARFMAVASLSATEVAVGSSDGTLLHFAVEDVHKARGSGGAAMRLLWQGVLNGVQPKPVMCVSRVPDCTASCDSGCTGAVPASRWLLAGDTNGVVYVFEVATHAVAAQVRLEQSCVNALSDAHCVSSAAVLPGVRSDDHQCWHTASLHDSGVVHLLRLEVCAGSAQIRLLSSVSTGLTAGRSVHWPAASLPLVVVTEERVLEFDATAAQRGELHISRTQRVSVRCVSGAAVLAEAGACAAATRSSPRVAVVGQGFEVVDWASA